MRVFAPVVVRGEEEKGVRIWGFSKTTYEALLRLVIDPEYGDITDVHTGTDIRVDYGKKAGQMYPTTEIRPMRKTSALAESDDAINGLLKLFLTLESCSQRPLMIKRISYFRRLLMQVLRTPPMEALVMLRKLRRPPPPLRTVTQ